MAASRAILTFCAALTSAIALAQNTGNAAPTARISGRLVFPSGRPVSFCLRLARVAIDGLHDEGTTITTQDGRFSFMAVPGHRYRIFLAAGGMKTPPKTADLTGGKDNDIGDMVFEYCPAVAGAPGKLPTVMDRVTTLRPEQIVIEPEQSEPDSRLAPVDPGLETYGQGSFQELPPCWSGPSLERRSEWESFPMVSFDQSVAVESFVGGKVKTIRVLSHDPKLTPLQIREEVRKVWYGVFRLASSSIMWSEGNAWNIRALIEYEDGGQSSIWMDGWMHLRVQDRKGKYWFIRQIPAEQ